MTTYDKQHNTWFISRHQGSIDWIKGQNIHIDKFAPHLDEKIALKPGDTIIGSLPVHIIANLNKGGVRFINLQIELPPELRGVELNARQINLLAPKLQEFRVMPVN
jgi:CRISPR-associated protein Csx16